MRKDSLLVLLIAATKGKLRLQKINWYIIFSYYFPACDIWYMREPVSSALCNPFSGASMFALQCVVQAPGSAGPRLDIVWFFNNTGGNTVPINITFPPLLSIAFQSRTVMNGELIELTSTITLGRLSDPIHAGRYYCQAQVDGATSSLTPSNALTFTANDSVFNLNPCGGSSGGVGLENFTQASTRCAGSISSSTVFVSSSTVTPTSTSQSGHSTSSPPTVLFSVLATSPTADNIFSTDVTTTVSTQPLPGQYSLSLWVYVLVGVAAVFAMIILVFTLLFIGLYLKKNKTFFNRELAKLCKFKKICWKIFRYYFCKVFCKQKYMHMSDNQLSCHLVTLKITSGTYFCCVLCYC